MNNPVRSLMVAVVMGTALLVASCAKVPPEVVQLSSILGEDLVATKTSYQQLITRHFDGQRQQVNVFIDTRWRPVFLQGFIDKGNLVGRAKGADPNKVLTDVNNWAQAAIQLIEGKRRELLDPIDAREAELRASVDEAFNRMVRANSTVTAHLNSIRKVAEFQDQIAQATGVRDLRDKINQALIDASGTTQKAIDGVAKADNVVTQIEGLLK